MSTQWRHRNNSDIRPNRVSSENRINTAWKLAAPQGFEPRYADPESAVLPLNEGAEAHLSWKRHLVRFLILLALQLAGQFRTDAR